MVGKPAFACLEGGPRAITQFLKEVRTDVFAQVDAAARKMTVSIGEEACTRVSALVCSWQKYWDIANHLAMRVTNNCV